MFLYKVNDKKYVNIDLVTGIRFIEENLWVVDSIGQPKGLAITEEEKDNLVAIMAANRRWGV